MAYAGGTVSWASGQTSLTTATCSGGAGGGAGSNTGGGTGGGTTVVAVSGVSVSPSSVSLSVGGATVTAVSSNGRSASVSVVVKAAGSAQRFSDVPVGAAFYDDIEAMADKGVIRGDERPVRVFGHGQAFRPGLVPESL